MLQKRQSPIAGALTLPKGGGNIASAATDMDVDSTQLLRHVNTPIVFAVKAHVSHTRGFRGYAKKGAMAVSGCREFCRCERIFYRAPTPDRAGGNASRHTTGREPSISRVRTGLIRYSGRCVIAGQTLSADHREAGGGLAKSELWGID
jgi:hypothetical protein